MNVRSVLALCFLLTVSSPSLAQQIIPVPTVSFPTIQSGIDSAVNGDIVNVLPGIYEESIDFTGKAITVEGAAGPDTTIISGTAENSVVRFATGEGPASILQGFTIANGGGTNLSPPFSFPITRGGGILCANASPTIRNCHISGNTASLGGGIHINGSPLIQDCEITSNTSTLTTGGGIAVAATASVTLERCTIALNTALNGGAGVTFEAGSSGVLHNCLIVANSAIPVTASALPTFGGGLLCRSGTVVDVINCSFTQNEAATGAGASVQSGAVSMVNSIFWGDLGPEIGLVVGATPSIDFCNVQGGAVGTGNIDADPHFVGVNTLDLHLSLGSPCINTGGDLATALPMTDFDGEPRVIFGTSDIGADEVGNIAASPAMVGNVGDGQGGVVNVLGINSSTGGPMRRVSASPGEGLAFFVQQPPAVTTPANFVIFGTIGEPVADEAFLLPDGIGTMAFIPCPFFAAAQPFLFTLATSFSPQVCGSLVGASPTPWVSRFVPGIPFEVTLTFQGIVEDGGIGFSVTNGLILDVTSA